MSNSGARLRQSCSQRAEESTIKALLAIGRGALKCFLADLDNRAVRVGNDIGGARAIRV